MKRILGIALVATMFALAPQQASAWSNIKFGAGFNFHWQTANNAFGHHLWRNGQIPTHHGHGGGFHYQPFNNPYYGPPMPHYPTSAELPSQGYEGVTVSYQPQYGYNQAPVYAAPQYITYGR